MKKAIKFLLLSGLVCVQSAVADATVCMNLVGQGTSSRPSGFSIASGSSADVTITANAGFVISAVVTNGVLISDYTGLESATITLESDDDVDLTATFTNENAWWIDPFVRNSVFVSSTGLWPDGCSLDADEVYFVATEGFPENPPGIHLYDVAGLKNSIDPAFLPLKSDNIIYGDGESGETVAVSSCFGAVFTTPVECESYAVRPIASDWSIQENFDSVTIDNLDEWSFTGGAFGRNGFYVTDEEYVYQLRVDVDVSCHVITNLHVSESWACPGIRPWSLNVKTIGGIDYVYGVFAGNDTGEPGNATLFVLDTGTGNVAANAFWANENMYEMGNLATVNECYSPIQITGTKAGTPRVFIKDDWFTYILDLDSDCKTLVSPDPVKVFEGYTDQDDIFDTTLSDIGGIAVTDDETRMFNLCEYYVEGEEDDEGLEDGAGYFGEEGGEDGDGEEPYNIVRLKVFEKAPGKYQIRGIFEYSGEDVEAGSCQIVAGEGTNIVYTLPQGYIKSVTTNGVPVVDFITRTNAYEFASDAVSRHVCVRMVASTGVARIGSEVYLTVEDALAAAEDGDTVELNASTSIGSDCTVTKDVTIDTCGFVLANNAEITVGSTGRLVITNNLLETSIRSFENKGTVVVNMGGVLDVHSITFMTGPPRADLDDGGGYQIKGGGFMWLPDVFSGWLLEPKDVEHEPGDYNYDFFAGTEIGAVTRIDRGEYGDLYFVCTNVLVESGHDLHEWDTVVASCGGKYYTNVADAIDAAEGDAVTLLDDVSYALVQWENVAICANGYTFDASVPASCTLRTVIDNGVTTYYAARNIGEIPDSGFLIAQVAYNGELHAPQVTITDGNEVLVEKVDYVIDGGQFRNTQPHDFEIVGTNRYASSVTKTFTITPVNIGAHSVVQSGTLSYAGTAQTPLVTATAVTVADMPAEFTYSMTHDGEYLASLPSFTNVGSYTVYYHVTAPNHNSSGGSFTVTVSPRNLTGVSVVQDGEMIEDGTDQVATVIATPSTSCGETVTFTYSTVQNGTYTSTVPAFVEAGTYTVYFKANANYHNEYAGTFEVTISEAGPSEVPEMVASTAIDSDGNFLVTVNGTEVGRDYIAYTTSDLRTAPEDWVVEQIIAGNGGTITFELPVLGHSKFVRVISTRHRP